MRAALVLSLILAALPIQAQRTEKKSGPPKKGDAIAVKGCLSGSALEAAGIRDEESVGTLASGLTFRLTGDKKLLKQLRDQYNGKVVEVEGILKSELPRDTATAGQLGRMRIAIGAPSAAPGSLEAENRRSFPVLQVKAFEGSTSACGR
jgi:hypothetical protein